MYLNKPTRKKLGFLGLFKKVFLISTLLISASIYAQNDKPYVINEKEGDFSQSFFDNKRTGDPDIFSIRLSNTKEYTLRINVKKGDVNDYRIIGNVTNNKSATAAPIFDFSKNDGKVVGRIIFQKQKKAFKIWTNEKNQVVVQREDINRHICIDLKRHDTDHTQKRDTSNDTFSKAAPQLESLPGASHVIYLDFDGEVVSGTGWAGGRTINAQPSGFSDQTILQVWRNMAEDFAPFKVNVTTLRSVFNATPKNRRIMAIFTPTDTAAPNAGGVAFLNSFNANNDDPTWIFNRGDRTAGETGSHEVGHTLGLRHDGTTAGVEYYGGHNGWAPIMGVSYRNQLEVGHWSKGEYSGANNREDDLAIITNTRNGFGYKTDDHDDGTNNATAIASDASGNVSASNNKGLIERNTDKDVFSFTTSGGNVEFAIDPYPYYPSLNIKARLLNSSGQQVASSDPAGFKAAINTNVQGGTYYLEIDGVGEGANPSVGYSDYSSLGNFTISGKYPKGGTDTQAPTTPTALSSSNVAQTSLSLSWTASTDNVGVTAYDVYQGNTVIASPTSTSYNVTGLTPKTAYQFRVKAKDAAGNVSGFSNTVSVTTLDDTTNPNYCASNGKSVTDEYISKVQLGSINNTSTGSSGGYGDYTSISTTLAKGASHTITITPAWTGSKYNEAYSVWIDYNKDGDFADSGEQVWTKTPSQDATVSGSFTVPTNAANGNTRMRVSMKYNGIPTPCESFNYGEVEDYTVTLGGGTTPTCNDGIQNGDETGIDCGGSSCEPCSTNTGVVYVDMADASASSSSTWNFFRIEVGDDNGFGAWFSGNTVRLVTYNKDVVCDGTSSNVTLLGEGIEVGGSSNFVANSNSYVVSSSSYTDWRGKSGYIGFQFKISGKTHYGWFYASVANDGLSYTILDYAYNTNPDQGLRTSRNNRAVVEAGIKDNTLNKIEAYPNPFSDTVNIDLTRIGKEVFTIRAYTILGKQVYEKKYTQNPGSITIGKQLRLQGTYFIKIESKSATEVITLIKEN